MNLIVQKFGGSSVADAGRLLRVSQIVREAHDAGYDVIVVVSAQGDATDELLQKSRSAAEAPLPRELDALLTAGEQISAALTAMTLENQGIPAVSLNAWQLPIRTNAVHGDAKIAEIGTRRVRAELLRRRVVIVTGFQGVDEAGDITTLGRGGSDYTAVALAAAFGAERCVIYTDVDGVYTADPRLCPAARRLERVAGVTCREKSGDALAAVTVVGRALPSLELEKRAILALNAAGIIVQGVDAGTGTLTVYVAREHGHSALCAVHDAVLAN